MTALRITEIFFSLQGESTLSGLPTIFIRLTGCPLRCGYCDTAYAFKGGQKYTFTDILPPGSNAIVGLAPRVNAGTSSGHCGWR